MATVFISHSSLDKEFARRLANDLKEFSHEPWLDEWEIKVGECIPSKIENALEKCDYIIVILSQYSVKSTWVEREWKIKYWDEANANKRIILPVKIEECQIPKLLQPKLYADFTKSYGVGLTKLVNSISPSISLDKQSNFEGLNTTNNTEVTQLLKGLQDGKEKLSVLTTSILLFAKSINNNELMEFCRNELMGFDGVELKQKGTSESELSYRMAKCYVSLEGINLQYIGWNNSSSNMFQYMENNPDKFFLRKIFYHHSLSEMESKPLPKSSSLFTFDMKASNFLPDSDNGDYPVKVYAKGDVFINVLNSVRTELIKKLIVLI